MIETLTVITLTMLYLIYFRPGKTPPLENPLIIERVGHYNITLAPLLNLAQPFIEEVAIQIELAGETKQYSATQCFVVYDKQVKAHGYQNYLLAITQRNGMLYFYAVSPQSEDPNNYLGTITDFANLKLLNYPAAGEYNAALDQRITDAVQEVSRMLGALVKPLTNQ
jgi:hypothetical protein